MSVIRRILLAVIAIGPIACDDGSPDDHDPTATETTTDGGTTDRADDAGDDSTGEAIEPTPVPFLPPLAKDCHATGGARIRDCDP